jgi:hypothetical protein
MNDLTRQQLCAALAISKLTEEEKAALGIGAKP